MVVSVPVLFAAPVDFNSLLFLSACFM